MTADKGRVERVRMLLEELGTAFAEQERKAIRRWQDSPPGDVAAREESYYTCRALLGIRRELENVLRDDALENGNA